MINELHLLEQMSSDEHLGSLAEAVLEAVRENPDVGAKVGLFFLVLNTFMSFIWPQGSPKQRCTKS